MNYVRIFDCETETLTEIPASELAPGYVRARVDGLDGDVFINAAQVGQSDFRHPPFDAETQKIFSKFTETFADVLPKTVLQWEDGFRHDHNPKKEIETWQKIADAYLEFSHGNKGSVAVRKDYLNIILSCVNNGCDIALQLVTLRQLSRTRAKHVVNELRKRGWNDGVNGFRIVKSLIERSVD